MSGYSVTSRPRGSLLTALALGSVLGFGGMTALAQDATPTATCTPPAAASTEMPGGMAATPVAAGEPTPAPTEIADRAAAVVNNFAACYNSDDLGAALGLVTPGFLESMFGLADAQEAEAALPELGLSPLTIVSTENASVYDDGRASIDVTYHLGEYQQTDARWFLVQQGDSWLLDGQELLVQQAEGDKAIISFSIADDASPVVFDAYTETEVSPVILLHGINNGAEAHTFRVLQAPATDGDATPGAVPEGGMVIGIITVAAGEQDDLALSGLPVGVYALVDPAVDGSVATLTVIEAAAE